jgi:hypothetical protein
LGCALKWWLTGDHLVEHHTQTPDVGARVNIETARLSTQPRIYSYKVQVCTCLFSLECRSSVFLQPSRAVSDTSGRLQKSPLNLCLMKSDAGRTLSSGAAG